MVIASHAHSVRLLTHQVKLALRLQLVYQTSYLETEITALLAEIVQLQLFQTQQEKAVFYHQNQNANASRDTLPMALIVLHANTDSFLLQIKMLKHNNPCLRKKKEICSS